jgi:hypothetical protein
MSSPDPRQRRFELNWWQVTLLLLAMMFLCPFFVLWGLFWVDDRVDYIQQRWEKSRIKKGLTHDEVRAIMGEPGVNYADGTWEYTIRQHYLTLWFKDERVDHVTTNSNLR